MASILPHDDRTSRRASVHSPLLGKNYFRILELYQGNNDDPVSFALRIESVDQPRPYKALSYTRGNEAPTCEVTCDGKTLLIRPNLMQALLHLRNRDDSRRLWIDALCINQNDLDEKSTQIPMMGRIYEQADQVLIWLRKSCDHSPKAIDLISKLSRLDSEDVSRHRDLYGHLLFGVPPYSRSGTEKKPHDDKQDEAAIAARLHNFDLPPPDMTHWHYVREILILSGNGTISWAAMGRVGHMMHPLGFPDIVGGRQWGIVSSINSLTVSEFQASAPPEAHAAATDPRDNVYALFGLQERLLGDMPPVKVDYKMSVKDLYRDMTRFILGAYMGHTDYLKDLPRIKSRQNDSIGPIPSWVRDFSTLSVPGPMNELASSTAQFPGSVKIWPSEDLDELILDGKEVDAIQATSQAIPLTSNLDELTKSLSQALPQWLSLVADLQDSRDSLDSATEGSILWLARMLLMGMPWSSFSRSELIYHFKALMTSLSQSSDTSTDRPRNSLSPAHESTAIERVLRGCRQRRLCATKRGDLCLAPAIANQGDVVAYFAGGYSFFVLRPCGAYYELTGVCRVVKYDGDAVQTLKDDALPWEKITLR